jgi:hypothetical protein
MLNFDGDFTIAFFVRMIIENFYKMNFSCENVKIGAFGQA